MSLLRIVDKFFGAIAAVINRVSLTFKWVGMVFITLIALVMGYEVFVRYVLDSPTRWALETSELSAIVFVYLTAGWVLLAEGHIAMEAGLDRLNARARHFVVAITSVLCAIGCAYLVYITIPTFQSSLAMKELTETIRAPVYVFKFVIIIGFGLLALQFIARAHKYFHMTGPTEEEHREEEHILGDFD